MVTQSQEASATQDREIEISRTFDAPRELVFNAWTTPEHVAQWFGPDGFTLTTHEMDVKPGGTWRFTMHGPDGVDYINVVSYIDVEPPALLRYDQGDDSGPQFQTTVTFTAQNGKTRLTMRMLFPTAAERDQKVKEVGAIEGGHQTLGRLADYLARG